MPDSAEDSGFRFKNCEHCDFSNSADNNPGWAGLLSPAMASMLEGTAGCDISCVNCGKNFWVSTKELTGSGSDIQFDSMPGIGNYLVNNMNEAAEERGDSTRSELPTSSNENIEMLMALEGLPKEEAARALKDAEDLLEKIKRGEPIPTPSSGCFIATAAYGTPFAEEIDILRNWRDDFLEASHLGRFFIKTYYSLSPPVADYISKSPRKRKLVRAALGPVVKILKPHYSERRK